MLKGNTSRAEMLTAGQDDFNWRAFSIALAIHISLAVLLFANWNQKIESAGPMQVELWSDGTPNAAPPIETEPTPSPPEPPKPVDPAPPPPPPPEPAITKAPEPVVDPEIAIEEDRKKKEAEKRQLDALEATRLEKEKLEKEKIDKARLEKIKQEKILAEKEQQRVEQAKQELIKQEELKIAQQKKEIAQAKAKAEEAAKKVEQAQAAEVAKKEAVAKAQAAEAAKKLADAKAAEAAKKAAADKALRDAFRSDVMGATGIPGGTASSNQAGGGSDSGYAGKIRSCIKPGVSFPAPIRSGNINPFAEFRVQLKSDGVVSSTTLRKPSGNTSFDRAVEAGIKRCTPFPAPPSGRYPSYIDVNYFMYD